MHAATSDLLRRLAPLRRELRRRRRMLALLALVLALASVLPSFAPAAAHTVPVVVAGQDIAAGHLISADDLRTIDVPRDAVPQGAPSSPDAVAGQRSATDLPAGVIVLDAAIRDAADPLLAPGRAVISVPVDPLLLPQITPGSDVLLVISSADRGGSSQVRAVVADVGDSAGQTASGGLGNDPASMNILVSADDKDAAAIAYATREGWVVVTKVR